MIDYKNTENYQKFIDLVYKETTGKIQLNRGVVEFKVPYNLRRKKDDESYSDSYVVFPDGKIRHIGRDNSSVSTSQEKKEAKLKKHKLVLMKIYGDSSETRNISIVRRLEPLKTEEDYNGAFGEILNLITKRKTNESKIYNFT